MNVLEKLQRGLHELSVKIAHFLGRELLVPQDRRYDIVEGLWVKEHDAGLLAVGATEATLLMTGAVREVENLVDDGAVVKAGDTVLLALTSKLKYIATPVSGRIHFPEHLSDLPGKLTEDPYAEALFFVTEDPLEPADLTDAAGYAAVLRNSEGARNPSGSTGGASPTCKAVYMGLGQQKLDAEP
jgi:glycine cleavage system H lipoate-binding protein